MNNASRQLWGNTGPKRRVDTGRKTMSNGPKTIAHCLLTIANGITSPAASS
jgi:hypothetical protein